MYDILVNKWNEIISKLKLDYDIADISFKTWIMPLSVDSLEDNTINIIYTGESAELALNLIKTDIIWH